MGMRVLLSVFACAPDVGSEGGVGWNWAHRMAREGYQVVVLTDASRRSAIEAFYHGSLPDNPVFVFYRPFWLLRVPLNSLTAQLLYTLWQLSLASLLKRLQRHYRFDYVHHLTYGVYRHPSLLWTCGVPFVFGPVGGGESCPHVLRKGMSFSWRVHEVLRDVTNWIGRFDPLVRQTLRRADLVFARTRETAAMFPADVRARTVLKMEIGTDPARVDVADIWARPYSGHLKILYAGRLLGLKGLHLALPAFARLLVQHPDSEFHLVGDGPEKKQLIAQCEALGIRRSVNFHPRVAQDRLFELYASFDCLLFPSLHDSGGNVVVESLSFGLPVVCLNLGGPACFVNDTCGRLVEVSGRNVDGVIDGLANALQDMSDPQIRRQCALGALRRADELRWDRQFEAILSMIRERVEQCAAGDVPSSASVMKSD